MNRALDAPNENAPLVSRAGKDYLRGMQIDQDPGDYRVQRPDGSWTQRVNKPLCRWMAIVGTAFLAFLAWRFSLEGGNADIPIFFGLMGACIGGAITLSLKSIDW